jgi:hypothetical protein
MAIIQVQVEKNIIEDVRWRSKCKHHNKKPHNKIKFTQTKTNPIPLQNGKLKYDHLGIIRNLKFEIHGIPYVTTFIVLQNNVVDSNYSMFLGRPWFKDAKVTHDQGNNVIIVQIKRIVKTISVNRKLGLEKTRRPQVLVCYDLMDGLTNEEEDLIFET